MGKETGIQWAHHTGSPWYVCTKVSEGCKDCYAEALSKGRMRRLTGGKWGKGAPRVRSKGFWTQARQWNREAGKAAGEHRTFNIERSTSNERPRIFPSLCDWLDEEAPIEWLADFLRLIYKTPNLDWLLLTKRPENFKERLVDVCRWIENSGGSVELHGWILDWVTGEMPPHNVWVIVSAETQPWVDVRVPELLKIPARVRGVSAEPLLGMINFPMTCLKVADAYWKMPGIDWVIVGCEQLAGHKPGRNASEYEAQAYIIIEDCQVAGVPVFHKQMPINGRVSGEPEEWDQVFRVREFPSSGGTPDSTADELREIAGAGRAADRSAAAGSRGVDRAAGKYVAGC